MHAAKILVVDDEPGVREALENILRDEGYEVASVASGEACLERLETAPCDLVLLDVWLPGMDGLETLVHMEERRVDTVVVMISGHGTIETAVRATKLGAFDFVEKPLSLEKTLLVVRNALQQRALERRNRRLLEQLARDTEILGRSGEAARLREAVEAASRSEAPVLLCGEGGTGRETLARRIHALGARSGEAFVDVACAALDSRTAAAVLFGGGEERGRVELARGGSLFLEEVGALDVGLQRRLAAELDQRGLGAPNVRVLASAGPQGAGLVPELRRVLDVIRIDVPALRERREDILILAERFLKQLCAEYGRGPKRLAPDAVAALRAYAWPGNIRELHNVIERVVLLVPGETIVRRDLPAGLGGASETCPEDLYGEFPSLAEGLAAFERYAIRRALESCRGDRAAAARRLGIPLGRLSERMRELGIETSA